MDFNPAARRHQALTLSTWVFYTVVAFGFGVGGWMLIYLSIYGAELRAAIENQRAVEIREENLEVCTRLGAPPGTAAFATCASELVHIRQRHDERRNQDFYFQ